MYFNLLRGKPFLEYEDSGLAYKYENKKYIYIINVSYYEPFYEKEYC